MRQLSARVGGAQGDVPALRGVPPTLTALIVDDFGAGPLDAIVGLLAEPTWLPELRELIWRRPLAASGSGAADVTMRRAALRRRLDDAVAVRGIDCASLFGYI